jgi:uncharacterized protein
LKRKVIDELIQWNNLNDNKPILLTGAKGVGKTYLAYDFAKAFFERIHYVNFERDHRASEIFLNNDGTMVINLLLEHFEISAESDSEHGILILDEIRCCNNYSSAIKLLQQSGHFRKIILISSSPISELIDDDIHRISVYPMEFDEFLRATGYEWYIEVIHHHYETNKKIPEIVHKELLTLHELYLQIGGMPGIINEYLNMNSVINVSEQHNLFLGSYHDYIQRDNADGEALKMTQVLDSIPSQLMKENKKFQYKLIRKGTTHSMYKDAIQRLMDYNYVIRCNKITTEQLQRPLDISFMDELNNPEVNTSFKLYLPDTGMLYSRLAEEETYSLDHQPNNTNEVSTDKYLHTYKHIALLENYVAQSLQSHGNTFVFWESDSMAKIDFIVLKDKDLLPIEIHDSENTRSKSISVLKQKCNFPYAIKISSKNFDYSNQIKYVPYYAVFCI